MENINDKKEELAKLIFEVSSNPDALDAFHVADVLWEKGWRKIPTRLELSSTVGRAQDEYDQFSPEEMRSERAAIADAILALMDGGSDDR